MVKKSVEKCKVRIIAHNGSAPITFIREGDCGVATADYAIWLASKKFLLFIQDQETAVPNEVVVVDPHGVLAVEVSKCITDETCKFTQLQPYSEILDDVGDL